MIKKWRKFNQQKNSKNVGKKIEKTKIVKSARKK